MWPTEVGVTVYMQWGSFSRAAQRPTRELLERLEGTVAFMWATREDYVCEYSAEAGLTLSACSDASHESHESYGATTGFVVYTWQVHECPLPRNVNDA